MIDIVKIEGPTLDEVLKSKPPYPYDSRKKYTKDGIIQSWNSGSREWKQVGLDGKEIPIEKEEKVQRPSEDPKESRDTSLEEECPR